MQINQSAAAKFYRVDADRIGGTGMQESRKLRELASGYREFAERTANPTIWDARLRMADDLEIAAERMECAASHSRTKPDHRRLLDQLKKENP